MLERERHQRKLDWVAVGIVLILVFLALILIFSSMLALMPKPGEHDMQGMMEREGASSWAKTFLTTIGGIAVGVLVRARGAGPARRNRDMPDPGFGSSG